MTAAPLRYVCCTGCRRAIWIRGRLCPHCAGPIARRLRAGEGRHLLRRLARTLRGLP